MKTRIAQILDILTACGIARADAYIPADTVVGGYVPADGDNVVDPTSPYSAPARIDPDGIRYPTTGVYRAAGNFGPVLDARPAGFLSAVGPTSCLVRVDRVPEDFIARVNADVRRVNGS